jgi:Tfp pilus assembly protein PilV
MRAQTGRATTGFSLIEALFATTIMVAGVVGLAQLFTVAVRANGGARSETIALMLAADKIEHLQSSLLVANDEAPAASPSNALALNVEGYSDFVDARGHSDAPGRARFARRWSIAPLPSDPANVVVLQVVSFDVSRPAARVRLVTVKTRRNR